MFASQLKVVQTSFKNCLKLTRYYVYSVIVFKDMRNVIRATRQGLSKSALERFALMLSMDLHNFKSLRHSLEEFQASVDHTGVYRGIFLKV